MSNYQAILIHPAAKGGRVSGNLWIKNNGVIFESTEINYQISLVNLSINAGGAGNRFVFFTDKNQNDISIYTSDKKVLKDTILVGNSAFKKEIKRSKGILNRTLKGVLAVFLIGILFIGGLYFFKDKMVEHLANQVPVSWEKEAGDELFSNLSLNFKIIKNDSLKKEFLKVAAPLFKQIEQKGYTIDLYFVKDSEINAFALPGGKVIIQTGLIENAKSWEEVMGVLSHELAHVTRRHHIRGIINNVGVFALLSATIGDISNLTDTFANVGGELASLSNSREFEKEADEAGWDYLVNAKISPSGLISFFETIKKESQIETIIDSTLNKSIDLSFLSTHPNTQDRIDRLKKKGESNQYNFKPLPNKFSAFKEALLKQK